MINSSYLDRAFMAGSARTDGSDGHTSKFSSDSSAAGPSFRSDDGHDPDEVGSLEPEDLDFLRQFVLSSAEYVEELESALCERLDEFWEMREHAYRIITGILIDMYRARPRLESDPAEGQI